MLGNRPTDFDRVDVSGVCSFLPSMLCGCEEKESRWSLGFFIF